MFVETLVYIALNASIDARMPPPGVIPWAEPPGEHPPGWRE